MIKYIVITALSILTIINPAYAANAIGKITHLDGGAVRETNDSKQELNLGDDIYLHDNLSTSDAGTLKITFIDETEIILGNKSTLVIDEYVYDPADTSNNKAKFNLDESVFHYISGLIAKKEQPEVTISLAFGSIGIRGTQIWRDMITDDQDRPTCRIYVEDGEIDVTNHLGQVSLGHEDGTMIHGPEEAPAPVKKWSEESIQDIKSKTKI